MSAKRIHPSWKKEPEPCSLELVRDGLPGKGSAVHAPAFPSIIFVGKKLKLDGIRSSQHEGILGLAALRIPLQAGTGRLG